MVNLNHDLFFFDSWILFKKKYLFLFFIYSCMNYFYPYSCLSVCLVKHVMLLMVQIFSLYFQYSLWNVIWIGWNAFLICFYLNVGVLDRVSKVFNILFSKLSLNILNVPIKNYLRKMFESNQTESFIERNTIKIKPHEMKWNYIKLNKKLKLEV